MPVFLVYLICLSAAMATVAGFLGAAAGASWGRSEDDLAGPLAATMAAVVYVAVTVVLLYLFASRNSPMGGPFSGMAAAAAVGLAAGNAMAIVFGMARPMLIGAGAGLVIGALGEFVAILGMVAQTSPLVLMVPITLIPAVTGAVVGFVLARNEAARPWELFPPPPPPGPGPEAAP
jgi:hypothetical protein